MKSNIEIRIVNYWPEDEIVELYKAGGWWKDYYDSSKINHLIKGSYVFAIAFDKKTKKAIGMGRVISDGVSDAYIQDVVVLPHYQKKGIGGELIKNLTEHCISKDILWIGLIAEPNQDEFYLKLGFNKMLNHVPMLYLMRD
jgi:ribosomal protein S18 acetylase RimI-like enzyme